MLALSLVLSLLIALSSCAAGYAGSKTVYTADELRANISAERDTEREYASEYFDAWDFPRFNSSKFKILERLYRNNFVDDVGDVLTRAELTAEIFLESYYEKTELTDADDVTDALISAYIETFGDDYSVYRTKEEYNNYSSDMSGSFVGIGVTVSYNRTDGTVTVIELSEGGGAEAAGILAGDLIISVDGSTIDDVGYDKLVSMIKGKEGTTVDIGVMREGEEKHFTVTRSQITEISVRYEIKNSLAYIKISSFKRNTVAQFKAAIDAAEEAGVLGIIYDVRGNPGGYLSSVVDMLDYIAPKGTQIVSFTNDYGDAEYAKDSHTVSLPTVVICDSDSASAAELFTSAVRDFSIMGCFPHKIVGETSFGKGIMQDTYQFIDGSSVTMTVAYYNPPLGENYHGVGISPDVPLDFPDNDGAWRAAAEAELLKLIEANQQIK